MTTKLLESVIRDRSEHPVTEQYRAWRAQMASQPEQHCKPSGGPAARAARFTGFDAEGLAEYLMPEGI